VGRKPRIEAAGGRYHVLNRGNYRTDVFQSDEAKVAFLRCLGEACEKTGWVVSGWCLMRNHYHLAIQTPEPNLVGGMQWFQATFAARFNRLRRVNGHLFQGRYKALSVEAGDPMGSLCHYIHLNPVRAGVVTVDGLEHWPWCSYRWIQRPRERAEWFSPAEALAGAVNLTDTTPGHHAYGNYLEWIAADELVQKKLGFSAMSKGWAVGSRDFKRGLLEEQTIRKAVMELGGADAENAQYVAWENEVDRYKRRLDISGMAVGTKSADWKVAIATAMKDSTTATNRWLATHLSMGSLYAVSRLAAECREGRRAQSLYEQLTAKKKA